MDQFTLVMAVIAAIGLVGIALALWLDRRKKRS